MPTFFSFALSFKLNFRKKHLLLLYRIKCELSRQATVLFPSRTIKMILVLLKEPFFDQRASFLGIFEASVQKIWYFTLLPIFLGMIFAPSNKCLSCIHVRSVTFPSLWIFW